MRVINQMAFSVMLLSAMTGLAQAKKQCISDQNQILKQEFQNTANYYNNREGYRRGNESTRDARIQCENAITDINNCDQSSRSMSRCAQTQYYVYCYGSERNNNSSSMRWLTDKCISVYDETDTDYSSSPNSPADWVDEVVDAIKNDINN